MTIDPSWFHLPIKTGTWGHVSIDRTNFGSYEGCGQVRVRLSTANEPCWITNDHTYVDGLGGLRTQYYNATGRVLVGGLGLGLVTLVVASKPEVTQVVVAEPDADVIAAFRANDWDESKIVIRQCNVECLDDEEGFDWILLDHLNQDGTLKTYRRYIDDISQVVARVGRARHGCDFFTWEELYHFWLEDRGATHSLANYMEFAAPLMMKKYSESELADYLGFYDRASRGRISPVDRTLSEVVKGIHERKRNGVTNES